MTNAEVIFQTLQWVEAHLREDLSVSAVAKKAGYSLHHFIRLWSGVIGSPPKEYIARRKLSEAARELAAGGRRVTDVAFDYGFKDLETFTRAFRREQGTTPTAVRRGARFPFAESVARPRTAPTDWMGIREAPCIDSIEAFTIVGRSIRVKSETDEVGRLWNKFLERAPTVPRAYVPRQYYQLAWWLEDAEDSIEIMVGIKTTDLSEVPIDLVGKAVPACTCLVFTHRGSMARIGESYRDIYQKWIPSSDRRPAFPFNFERYTDGQSDPYSDSYSMQICVPVQ